MNKSKFLKKSLAVLLAVLMATAMIPLSAAAAPADLTLKEARVVTDEDTSPAWLQVDEDAQTITGSISDTATLFQLQLLPDDAGASVNYAHVPESDKPSRAMAKDSGTGIWHTGTDLISGAALAGNDALSIADFGGSTVSFKVELVKGDDKKEYTVTLNTTANPVDNTVVNFEVWAANNTYTVKKEAQAYSVSQSNGAQAQIGITKISKDKATIDITVPYDAKSIWVRDIQLGNGARATATPIGGAANTSTNVVNDYVLVGSDAAWTNNKETVTMLVEAGGMRHTYTVTYTRASGFESFTGKEAIDSRIFSDDGKIVVVMPFGTAEDTGTGKKFEFTPDFVLQFASTNVPTLKIRPAINTAAATDANFAATGTTLTSGETTVELLADLVDETYQYKDPSKRLNSTSVTKYSELGLTSPKPIAKVDVTFVEGTTRTYDLIVAEATNNYQSEITEVQIGTETATIDQAKKTIDITLPHGTDLKNITPNTMKVTVSHGATVTLPFQTGVAFVTVPANTSRGVSSEYTGNGTKFDGSAPTTIRVTSQDATATPVAPYTGNVTLYTLNVHVSDNYEMPAITSLTLKDKKGNDYKGVLTKKDGYNLYTVTVPYGTRLTKDLEGWKLFYTKTVGSAVTPLGKSGATLTGLETYLDKGNPNGSAGVLISTNGAANLAAKEGTPINVTSSVLGDNENAKDEYRIVLVRAIPGHNSKLSSLTLAANGEETASIANNMADKDLNNENSFKGTMASDNTITVELPWSLYIQHGQTVTGMNDYNHVVDALRAKVVPQDENADVWYNVPGAAGDAYAPFVSIPTDDKEQTVWDFDTNASLKIAVFSEQVATDIKGKDPTDDSDVIDSNGAIANLPNSLKNLKVPEGDVTYYTIKLKVQDKGLAGKDLTAISLVDPVTGRKAPLTISGDKITGSVPYGMTAGQNLYFEYTASPRAFLFACQNAAADDYYAVKDDGTLMRCPAADPGYPYGSGLGHFDNWTVWGDTTAHTCESPLSYYGGAYVKVDRADGKLKVYSKTQIYTGKGDNVLYLTNEDMQSGVNKYTVKLTVATPNTDPSITSFKLDGQTGTIDQKNHVINVRVPSTSDLTALKAEWTLATGATLTQNWVSGDPMNFTTERLFTVRAENEKAQATYRVVVTQDSGFYDVKEGSWYYNDVMTAYNNKWISGTGNGYFSPANPMKRGDFAMLIAQIKGYDKTKYTESAFPDVPADKYYSPAIAYCYEQGYIAGDNGNFNPEKTITRQEAAVFMCKVAELTPINGNTKFADDAQIGGWAKKFINACVNAGIYSGKDGNRFDPKAQLKRCEGASLLVRAFNK